MHNTLITEHVILRFLSGARLFLALAALRFSRGLSPAPLSSRRSHARDRTHRSATLHRFALTPPPDIEKRLIVRYTYRFVRSFAPLSKGKTRRRIEKYVTFRRRFFISRDNPCTHSLGPIVCLIEREISISKIWRALCYYFSFDFSSIDRWMVLVGRARRRFFVLHGHEHMQIRARSSLLTMPNERNERTIALKLARARGVSRYPSVRATRYNIITGLWLPV